MMRIAFLDRATFAPHLTLPRPGLPHHWQQYPNTRPEETTKRLAGADIAMINKVALRRPQLEQLPQLQCIVLTATGFDNVDLDCCKERGIGVANVRNYASASLAEHTLGLMLALTRNLAPYLQAVAHGSWSTASQFCLFDYPISDLQGSTLCVIGKGSSGSRVAELAGALGMRVVFAGRKHQPALQGYTEFYQALGEADVISLHCPLNEQTKGLLGKPEFAAMSKQPLLINTARGGLVDSPALLQALLDGQLRGAALDVLPQEPPPGNDPLLVNMRRLPNLLITPHVAWASDQGQLAAWNQALENIEAFARGKQLRRLV